MKLNWTIIKKKMMKALKIIILKIDWMRITKLNYKMIQSIAKITINV